MTAMMGPRAARSQSNHQVLVEEFMRKAEQEVPFNPTIPDADVRLLRARLVAEEALELIEALGIFLVDKTTGSVLSFDKLNFMCEWPVAVDIAKVADGVCDTRVVATGTLSAFGLCDWQLQQAIDLSNLEKFGPGGHKHPETGKWIKPENWKTPDLAKLIDLQRQPIK